MDVVRAWRPPFNPSGVVEECAAVLASYGVRAVVGSALYLDLLPAVNAGTVELPDVPELLRELRGLERRRGPSSTLRERSPASRS